MAQRQPRVERILSLSAGGGEGRQAASQVGRLSRTCTHACSLGPDAISPLLPQGGPAEESARGVTNNITINAPVNTAIARVVAKNTKDARQMGIDKFQNTKDAAEMELYLKFLVKLSEVTAVASMGQGRGMIMGSQLQ
jgi:hypothetical protein